MQQSLCLQSGTSKIHALHMNPCPLEVAVCLAGCWLASFCWLAGSPAPKQAADGPAPAWLAARRITWNLGFQAGFPIGKGFPGWVVGGFLTEGALPSKLLAAWVLPGGSPGSRFPMATIPGFPTWVGQMFPDWVVGVFLTGGPSRARCWLAGCCLAGCQEDLLEPGFQWRQFLGFRLGSGKCFRANVS